MDPNDPIPPSTHKPQAAGVTLPAPLDRLLANKQLLSGLGAEDLREMSKFGEIPNLAGVAAHTVRYPAEPCGLRIADCGGEAGEPPQNVLWVLEKELIHQPCIVTEGTLAGGSGARFGVRAIVPQEAAHLALALQTMLWPLGEEAGPAAAEIRFTLFLWPRPLTDRRGRIIEERQVVYNAGRGCVVTIGTDDLSFAVALLSGSAKTWWEKNPKLRLAPAGETALEPEADRASARMVPANEANRPAAEAFLIEDERWATPLWANPPAPACACATSAAWREAALGIGSMPIGVATDGEGRFPLLQRADAERAAETGAISASGEIVLLRKNFPEPFAREAKRWALKN